MTSLSDCLGRGHGLRALASLVVLGALSLGCEIRKFEFVGDGGPQKDGGLPDVQILPDVGPQDDASGTDSLTDTATVDGSCIKTDPPDEICDGVDNDCNGEVDDVDQARLDHDPAHCGACDVKCADTGKHIVGDCAGGECGGWRCSSGLFADVNGDKDQGPQGDGCECQKDNGGNEICDEIDNDCNGVVDDGFDKTQSPNCGTCGIVCYFPNAAAECSSCDGCATDSDCLGCDASDQGGRKCTMGACAAPSDPNALFFDLDGDPANGCEYYCVMEPSQNGTPSALHDETCDGYDNDCDGCVDGDWDGTFDTAGKRVCVPNTALTTGSCGTDEGECKSGVVTCQGGAVGCFGAVGPVYEQCNGKDDDCDGTADNGYDRQSDPKYCLGAGYDTSGLCKPCNLPHAAQGCVNGQCVIAACKAGWVDLDHDPATGCEYQCSPTGPEVCDGKDNDCDGDIDEDFNLQTDPYNCGTCGHRCIYAHAAAQCTAGQCQMGACNANYYDVENGDADGCEYYCNPPGGVGAEVCDNIDNDCNGVVDDGVNKQTDPANCGSCGHVCQYFHAAGTCSGGVCAMGACETGWVDLDTNPATGCEYQCTATGAEVCDGLDNDCNGQIDETFTNKGQACTVGLGLCRRSGVNICRPDHSGTCCGSIDTCLTAGTPEAETCNGLDDNCDDTVDNVLPPSDPSSPVRSDPNNCGACGNRCDQTYCGTPPCPDSHAVWQCTVGVCQVLACKSGWVNLDGDKTNGCEYFCTPSGPEICDGVDNDCNGKIDMADTASLVWPSNFCKCGIPAADTQCNAVNECRYGNADRYGAAATSTAGAHYAGQQTFPVCTSVSGVYDWYCNYPLTVDLVTPDTISFQELRCDGKDNNCDGQLDEAWPAKGQACVEDGSFGTTPKIGACRGSGTLACNTAQNGLVCNVTSPGATPADETCDNQDNDCDGLVDEPWTYGGHAGVLDSLIHVVRAASTRYAGGLDFYAYRYEAVRPDAQAGSAGMANARACSKAGVMPWGQLNLAAARAACAGAGMRLCTRAEWTATCEGLCDVYRADGCWLRARATLGGGSTSAGTTTFVFTGTGFQPSDVGRAISVGADPLTGTFYEIVNYLSSTQVRCAGSSTVRSGLIYTVMAHKAYPYNVDFSVDYAPNTCNGSDYGGITDVPLATGSLAQCVADEPGGGTGDGARDMSGNLKEWTEDYRGPLDTRGIYTLRGGGYADPQQGLTCTFLDTVAAEDFSFPTTGFRCCSPCQPGLQLCTTTTTCTGTCTSPAFCDTPTDAADQRHCAACVDLGSSNANCGSCGHACTGGTTCQNGACK